MGSEKKHRILAIENCEQCHNRFLCAIFGKATTDTILGDCPLPETEEKALEVNIRWCSLCFSWYIKCPRCGNNTCSGGYGEDGNCPVCPQAYELQDQLNKKGLSPLVDKLLGKD